MAVNFSQVSVLIPLDVAASKKNDLQLIYCFAYVFSSENGEKRSITCTEDSYPEQQLVVDLPPPSVVDKVPELVPDEQNPNNGISDVRVGGEENTAVIECQTKGINLPRRSPRLVVLSSLLSPVK